MINYLIPITQEDITRCQRYIKNGEVYSTINDDVMNIRVILQLRALTLSDE